MTTQEILQAAQAARMPLALADTDTKNAALEAMAVALTIAERALNGRGACRVHGGGFAGTIQAFVPLEHCAAFRQEVESMLGAGCCHMLSIRPVGGAVLWP